MYPEKSYKIDIDKTNKDTHNQNSIVATAYG